MNDHLMPAAAFKLARSSYVYGYTVNGYMFISKLTFRVELPVVFTQLFAIRVCRSLPVPF